MKRILIATVVVAGAGAAATALAAVLVLLIVQMMDGGVRSVWDAEMLSLSLRLAAFAAVLGAVVMPVAGWALLRRVPIWLGAAATIAGAVVGGTIGERWQPFNPYSDTFPSAVIGILLGFLVTAVALSVWFRNRSVVATRPRTR